MGMIGSKRGWMRLLESIIAVMILTSVLIVVYANRSTSQSYAESVHELEKIILDEISKNESLRASVLAYGVGEIPSDIVGVASSKLTSSFDFNFSICDIDSPADCNLEIDSFGEVFVDNIIISANLQTYSPKLVRLYVWEN